MSNLSEKDFAEFYEAYKNVYASQEVDEAKDDSYLETDMKKRRENNEKAVEDMKKTKAHKDMVKAAGKHFGEATAMAKRGLNEPAIRQQIAKSTGGGQAADRATALADKQTYGQSGVDPKARQKLAAKQRGDFRNTTSSNPGLHGYAHKAETPADKAKQAARGAQRGALTPNERKQLNMGYQPEGEMSEAVYRTTASGNRVRWDEDDAIDNAVSDRLQRQREAAAKKAAQARMKAKGTVPTKNGKPVFEEVVEFLYVEGYADTIEAAELIAENAAEEWIEMILEKDQTEIGITGLPIPAKNMSPAKRHEFEKKRRENLKKQPGQAGDSKLIQALRKKAQDTGNYAEAKVDWQNRDKENVQHRINVLRDRNRRLESDHPEVASGKYQTDFRRKRHEESRGKKK